ncbi:styrene monooxygenase/indole monooxygenase family protein [Nocardiopsis sp. CNS-639]|uniref:styrene monooxygenase/indole monooxygenase family protein n=1 Tax=Nocardiopsis sp. CNS-639 TaxID=1169153 RepID=UPI00036AC59C|nr:styrene monooxygenase/indole monooxygenase family protein [Nocardiopsis sp. CNS-639]
MSLKCLIVGAGQSGLVLAHALLSAGADVTVVSGRSSMDLRKGRAQITQLTLPHGLAVESSHNLSLWTGIAPRFDQVSLSVVTDGGGQVGFTGALPGIGLAVDPRVKLADWLEFFEDRGGKVVIHGLTVTDLEYFTRPGMYDVVLLAVGDGELGQILDDDHTRAAGTRRGRNVTQAYVTGLQAPEDQVGVYSGEKGEVYAVPTLTAQGQVHSVMLIGRAAAPSFDGRTPTLDAVALGKDHASIHHPKMLLHRMCDMLRLNHIPLWEQLREAELLDPFSVLIKGVTPKVRRPVYTFDHGGSLLGVADTVITVPPQCGQGWEASVRSAQVYADRILAHAQTGRAFDASVLNSIFTAYMEHSGAYIDVFEQYVDNFWTGQLSEAEQDLFQRACADQAVADDYVAGFANPERLVRMLRPTHT